MKKWLLLALGLLACLGVSCVGYLWATAPRHHINQESFEKIKVGMTLQQVQEILGGPPGDYGPGVGFIAPRTFSGVNNLDEQLRTWRSFFESDASLWLAGDWVISVRFDNESRVSGKMSSLVLRAETIVERLQRWLRLPWW